MKHLQIAAVTLILCTSVSLATFTYTISDTYKPGTTIVDGQKSLLVTGAGALGIAAYGSSYIEVRGTDPLNQGIGGIYTLALTQNSTLNYYGGETGGLNLYDNATAVLRGGSINYLGSYQNVNDNPHITIICEDYEYFDNYAIEYGKPIDLLRVQWDVGGDWIEIKLVDKEGYASVIDNIHFIPEPTALALFGLGSLLLRRKK